MQAKRQLVTGGGLGDAAMSFAKLHSENFPYKIFDWELTHLEVHSTLLKPIREFYDSQGVPASVREIPNWDWYEINRDNYEAWVGTHWHKYNDGEESWEINPFPDIKYDHIDGVDVLISPIAGRNSSRSFNINDLKNWYSSYNTVYDIHIVGSTNERSRQLYEVTFGINSMMNLTNIKQLVDMVCSCDIFIGQSGFTAYLAGMAGKKCYIVSEGLPTINRVHPQWDVTYINSIYDATI